jgi:hypothetical protein
LIEHSYYQLNNGNRMNPKFSDLKHSTASVMFRLTNVQFKESELIKKVSSLDGKKTKSKQAQIVKVGCNFGEVLMKGYKEQIQRPPITNRGRKRQDSKNTRKKQGNGKYFNSQITLCVKLNLLPFNVYADTKKRTIDHNTYELDKKDKRSDGEFRVKSYIYKVKVYRDGKGQIVGLRTEDEREVTRILKPIKQFFSSKFPGKIKAIDFDRFIQNYKACIIGDCHYEITKILNYFESQDTGEYPKKIFRPKCSTHSKLLVYFNTPTTRKPNKRTNLTIYRKGSINIDGAINRESANEILNYFRRVLKKNPKFLFDPNAESSESSTEDETLSSSDEEDSDLGSISSISSISSLGSLDMSDDSSGSSWSD